MICASRCAAMHMRLGTLGLQNSGDIVQDDRRGGPQQFRYSRTTVETAVSHSTVRHACVVDDIGRAILFRVPCLCIWCLAD
jgi:hypothetical protein